MTKQERIRNFLNERNAMFRNMLPEESEPLYDLERQAGKDAGHEGSAVSEYMLDYHACSCGWKSRPYNDGREYAYDDWIKHIVTAGVRIRYRGKARV